VLVYCSSVWCNHSATLNADWLPGNTYLIRHRLEGFTSAS
jgi:hypothetical protein